MAGIEERRDKRQEMQEGRKYTVLPGTTTLFDLKDDRRNSQEKKIIYRSKQRKRETEGKEEKKEGKRHSRKRLVT